MRHYESGYKEKSKKELLEYLLFPVEEYLKMVFKEWSS